ncbi:hypothetical protein [Desulfosoma sp.]
MFITGQYNDSDWAAARLIDEAIGKGHGYSAKDASPQEILFELPKTAILSSVIIDPYTTEREDRWAKDVEIWVSTVGPYPKFVTFQRKVLISLTVHFEFYTTNFSLDGHQPL